jgi:maltose alpha-D-glucosyltransferase/alpha-amylase
MGAGRTLKSAHGELTFRAGARFAELGGQAADTLKLVVPPAQSSNTIVALGERLFMKAYRRLQVGVNPEVEVGRYLTDVAGFRNSVPLAGSVDYASDDGKTATLLLLQGFVENQGDGWDYTLNYLRQSFERWPPAPDAAEAHGGYLALVRTLGTRTAELHAALAASRGDPAFDPEPVRPDDVGLWVSHVEAGAARTFDRLADQLERLPAAAGELARAVLARREQLAGLIRGHAGDATRGARTRLHGDFHLGQVLLVQNDWVIVDFEGEPARPFDERRAKLSPLKDVAGMLRSFDYAMHAALAGVTSERPDAAGELRALAHRWRQAARTAFVDGYDETARVHGLAEVRDEEAGLVELFVLDKLVYELGYELANRPDWVPIPLAGLTELLVQRAGNAS